MVTPSPSAVSALAVADRPGHILERIARGWSTHAEGVSHAMTTSRGRSNYTLTQLARSHDVVHWLDQIRFETCGMAVGRPQVVMVHHLVDSMHGSLLPRLRHADGITTVSEYWKRRLEQLAARPVDILPNSVDSALFRPPSPLEREAAREGLQGTFVLGFVGKAGADHEGRKGVELLSEVVEAAANRWPGITLALVGPGWEALAGRMQSAGVRVARRIYADTLETVKAYWGMDALLVTSSTEGGPCTTLEAMASGVPVVSSNVGHVPETISDGVTGFVCVERRPEEYLAALGVLLSDAERSRAVSGAAREFVARHRDDRTVIPTLPLGDIYASAVRSFRGRSLIDHQRRRLSRAVLSLRHVARLLIRSRP